MNPVLCFMEHCKGRARSVCRWQSISPWIHAVNLIFFYWCCHLAIVRSTRSRLTSSELLFLSQQRLNKSIHKFILRDRATFPVSILMGNLWTTVKVKGVLFFDDLSLLYVCSLDWLWMGSCWRLVLTARAGGSWYTISISHTYSWN